MIVSADTLVYFGALEDVVAAAAGALRPGGRLIFTVEEADRTTTPMRRYTRISPHGRYSHAREYVERVLADAGSRAGDRASASCGWRPAMPVAGLVVRATKPTVQGCNHA